MPYTLSQFISKQPMLKPGATAFGQADQVLLPRHPQDRRPIRVHPRHPWLKPSCPMNPSPDITWKIAADPASLSGGEFWARYSHLNMPEKFEAIEGKLFWSDEQRLHVLAMLLEAVGLRRALALCPPEAIRAALAEQPG